MEAKVPITSPLVTVPPSYSATTVAKSFSSLAVSSSSCMIGSTPIRLQPVSTSVSASIRPISFTSVCLIENLPLNLRVNCTPKINFTHILYTFRDFPQGILAAYRRIKSGIRPILILLYDLSTNPPRVGGRVKRLLHSARRQRTTSSSVVAGPASSSASATQKAAPRQA